MPDQQTALLHLKKPLDKTIQSASIEMKRACRVTKRYACAQELFARWPNLRESSQRLTSLLTLYWPDHRKTKTGNSLLVNCLDAGFGAAEKANQTQNHQNHDLTEQQAFIRCVSEELVQCLGLTLMIRRGGFWTVYDPSIQGYLDEIMKSPVSEELAWINKPHDAFASPQSKLLCASRVFSMAELKLAGLLD